MKSSGQKFSGIFSVLPRISTILFISLFLGAVGIGHRMMNMDGDLGRHLTIGNYILTHAIVPLKDLFSYTMAGQSLTPHEWLSEVLFTLAYRVLNLGGVVFLTALIIAISIWLVFKEELKRGSDLLLTLILTILIALTTSIHWLTRPHIFTFLMVTLWTICLERMRRKESQAWWLLPIIMLFWVNLHGGFIMGFAILVLYGLGFFCEIIFNKESAQISLKDGKYFLLGGGLALLTTLINPATYKVWTTGMGFLGNSYLVNHTMEYLSPDFHNSSFWPFLLLIGISILACALAKKRIPITHLFMIAAWILMGLYSARNIPIFALTCGPFIIEALSQWLKEQNILEKFINYSQRLLIIEQKRRFFSWSIPVVLLVVFLLAKGIDLDFSQNGYTFDSTDFPVSAVDWLQQNVPSGQHIFNSFTWGGYMLYRLWPEETVFIDGQTDFYGEALTRQYEQVIDFQTGWEQVLNQYQVTYLLIPPDSALAQGIKDDSSWKVIYHDQTAEIVKHE